MLGIGRMILKMAGRVVGFLEANPLTQPAAMEIVRTFGATYQLVLQRSAEQESGLSGAQAMTDRRSELRARIQQGPLRLIRRIVKTLAGQVPSVALATAKQQIGRSNEAFLASVQAIRAEVESHLDILVANGMTPSCLPELVSLEQEFLQAQAQSDAQRRLHTGATAELKGLTKKLMVMVAQLDGIVKYEFRGNLKVLGEWESARNVAWPTTTTQAASELRQLPAPSPSAQDQSRS